MATIGVAFGLTVAGATAASADVTGPCEGSGTFRSSGRTYDARDDRIVVPDADDVSWRGSIDAPGTEERSHQGRIELQLPPPLPSVVIADWGSDATAAVRDDGVYDYELPAFVPRGVTLHLTGEHIDTAGTCTGSLEVEIEGGPLDAPAPLVGSLVGTAAAAAGLAAVARPAVRRP